MGVDVELLLLKSAITGTLKMTPAVFFVVNQAGSAASTPEQVFQAIDSTFPSQVTMGSQWICSPSPGNAADVIRRNIEKLRMARQANQTVFSHAVWCRVDEAGIMKRATIDLSQDPSPARFRTVTEKGHAKKTPAQSQTPRTMQRRTAMSDRHEEKKLVHDTEAVGTEVGSAPVDHVPDMMEQIMEFCINGARGDDGKVKGKMPPASEADRKKWIDDIKAATERWPMNTPRQRIDYMVNGATWLDLNR
jgi:hypothetical protein